MNAIRSLIFPILFSVLLTFMINPSSLAIQPLKCGASSHRDFSDPLVLKARLMVAGLEEIRSVINGQRVSAEDQELLERYLKDAFDDINGIFLAKKPLAERDVNIAVEFLREFSRAVNLVSSLGIKPSKARHFASLVRDIGEAVYSEIVPLAAGKAVMDVDLAALELLSLVVPSEAFFKTWQPRALTYVSKLDNTQLLKLSQQLRTSRLLPNAVFLDLAGRQLLANYQGHQAANYFFESANNFFALSGNLSEIPIWNKIAEMAESWVKENQSHISFVAGEDQDRKDILGQIWGIRLNSANPEQLENYAASLSHFKNGFLIKAGAPWAPNLLNLLNPKFRSHVDRRKSAADLAHAFHLSQDLKKQGFSVKVGQPVPDSAIAGDLLIGEKIIVQLDGPDHFVTDIEGHKILVHSKVVETLILQKRGYSIVRIKTDVRQEATFYQKTIGSLVAAIHGFSKAPSEVVSIDQFGVSIHWKQTLSEGAIWTDFKFVSRSYSHHVKNLKCGANSC